MRASEVGWLAAMTLGAALAVVPAAAGDAPVGPCSPYRATDGDIASEMPGCARHRRPEPGSLDDELAFSRRRRDRASDASEAPDDDAPSRPRRSRRPRE